MKQLIEIGFVQLIGGLNEFIDAHRLAIAD
jgi:hypothetical protein